MLYPMKMLFLAGAILFIFNNQVGSQTEPWPKHYVCYQTNTPIIIDGLDQDSIWSQAEWTDDFTDIQGDKLPQPRFRTRMKMLWDNHYLYVFAQLYEPDIWGNLKQRDTIIYHDNDFEIFLDPDGDTHRYYEFEINALNTPWDLFLNKPYRDGGDFDNSWDYQDLKSAVHIYGTLNQPSDKDSCWTVELALPFNAYRDSGVQFPPQTGDQWRVNFSRVEWQTYVDQDKYIKVKNKETGKPLPEDNWVWSPQGQISMHMPEKWGFLQFSDQVAGKGQDQFIIRGGELEKLELREYYYLQRHFKETYKRYATTLKELKSFGKIPGEKELTLVTASEKQYEMILPAQDKQTLWHINETGRVWSTGR